MSSSYIQSSERKNPSRKTCEEIIEKILTRELEANGRNHHFKQAADFISYFESLYPASPSLTKQVQRAISAMNLPKDKDGYFMIHKTAEEYELELELGKLLPKSNIQTLESCRPVLLKTEAWKRQQLLYILETCEETCNLFDTLVETNNGILVYTSQPDIFSETLSKLIEYSGNS